MYAADRFGHQIAFKARKTRALLGLLALRSPRVVLRSEITSLLWSRRDVQQARGSLRQALHELQSALGAEARHLLEVTRSHVGLRLPLARIDAAALMEEDASEQALDAYQPVLLGDLAGIDAAFDQLIRHESERFALGARRLAERLLLQAGQTETVPAAERLLRIDPAHEGAWRAIIQAHARAGDRTAAATAFDRCKTRLAVHGLEPAPETVRLFDEIRAIGLSAASPVAEPRERGGGAVRIGVMPLASLDADAAHGLSLGLAEEITAALAPFRGFSCVASTSLGAIATEVRATSAAWAALNLDFLLEGTIQSHRDRYRIMARLLDLRSAETVIWARRFEAEHDNLLSLQDEIASAIAAQIAPEMLIRLGEGAASRRVADPTAHDLMLRAIPSIYRLDAKGFHEAGQMLEQALELDPNNAAAHAWLVHWHVFHIGQGWAADPKAACARAIELAERSVTLDPGDARALALAGHARGFLAGRPQEAEPLHERALSLNPNLALAWSLSGLSQVYLGRHEKAVQQIGQAQFLSPYDPHGFFFEMALAMPLMLLGDCERAADHGRRAIELNPGFSSSYKPHLATLGHLGRTEDAATVRGRLLALEPALTVATAVEWSPLTRAEDRRRYAEGLRKAGLSDA